MRSDPVGEHSPEHVVALGQRDAVVEAQEVVGLVVGRLVLDQHDHVAHQRRQLVGDLVQGTVDERLEGVAVHLHRHHAIVPDVP